jgi:hypothetical protein
MPIQKKKLVSEKLFRRDMPRKIMFILCWTPTTTTTDEEGGITYTNNDESDEDAKKSSMAIAKETSAAEAQENPIHCQQQQQQQQTLAEKVSAWQKTWKFQQYAPPYFSPSFFYSPLAFTLEPMDEICILFDRNDEIMSAETCDCQCNAGALEKRLYLSYKLINTSTMTSVHVDLGTCLSALLEANMIASTLVPVNESIKYNEEAEEDEEDIPYWQQL